MAFPDKSLPLPETITGCADMAHAVTEALVLFNAASGPVQSLVVLPLIQRARELTQDLRALDAALLADCDTNLTVTRADGRVVPVSVPEDAPRLPGLWDTLATMKREILEDMHAGRVPKTVTSFAQLHDHVDANEYGGFCDSRSEFARAGYDDAGHLTEAAHDFVNRAQGLVDEWLKAGRPHYATEFPHFPLMPEVKDLEALGLSDHSWHNDACPRFNYEVDADTCHVITVWVEHPEKGEREMDGPRYCVDEDDENGSRSDPGGERVTLALNTDDWQEVLAEVKKRIAGYKGEQA